MTRAARVSMAEEGEGVSLSLLLCHGSQRGVTGDGRESSPALPEGEGEGGGVGEGGARGRERQRG